MRRCGRYRRQSPKHFCLPVTLLFIVEDSNLLLLVCLFVPRKLHGVTLRKIVLSKLITASILLYKEYTFSFIQPVTALQVSAGHHRDVTGRNQTCSNSIDLQVRFIGFATVCLCASDFVCVCVCVCVCERERESDRGDEY